MAFYVPDAAIAERVSLLNDIATGLATEGVLASEGMLLRRRRIPLLVNGYFLLNKAYKDRRIPDQHHTEKPKIAALQAITIVRFEPFIPLNTGNVIEIVHARCNEIFAFTYAMAILEKDFKPDTPEKIDFWIRLLEIMHETSAETIEPYIVDIEYQTTKPLEEYHLDLNPRDMLGINSLISIFEMISNKGAILS